MNDVNARRRPLPPDPAKDPCIYCEDRSTTIVRKTLLFIVAVFAGAAALVICLAAQADVGFIAFNTGTNGTYFINTNNYKSANVTVVAASGTPDGTVTIYTVPGGVDDVSKRVQVEQYATPTTAKAYIGPCQGGLVITLTGNTTGTVSVTGSLK